MNPAWVQHTFMPEIIDTFSIDATFNGPPTSANGGYVCGRLADYINGAVSIRLHAPPPLNKSLQVWHEGEQVQLKDGEQLLISATATSDLQRTVPAALSTAQCIAAGERSIVVDDHIFPNCFVCGPLRQQGDGLCIHVGPCDSEIQGLYAGSWLVDKAFAADDGRVASRFLWAALDCPSAYVNDIPLGTVFLLGSLKGQIFERPAVGAHCQVLAWPLAREGRKHFAATAILAADGQLLALSEATWIELKQQA